MAPRPPTRVKAHCKVHGDTPNPNCYACQKLAGKPPEADPNPPKTITRRGHVYILASILRPDSGEK
jgi:hypothetical protein